MNIQSTTAHTAQTVRTVPENCLQTAKPLEACWRKIHITLKMELYVYIELYLNLESNSKISATRK